MHLIFFPGKYYLVDAGYMNCEGFLAPYRGQRYHLNEWREGHQPRTARECFNMRHSAVRNVIERCFDVLKLRWAILRSASYYPVKIQNWYILACCLLHNLIRRDNVEDPLKQKSDTFEPTADTHLNTPIVPMETSNLWNNFREHVANDIFQAFVTHRDNW